MKRMIIIICIVCFGTIAHSQVLISLLLGDKLNSEGLEFGLEGGINWTQISNMDTRNFARKWNLGFYFDIRLKNQWYLYTGVLVKSNMGVDKLTDNDLDFLEAAIFTDDTEENNRLPGDYSQKMNYFLVPALAKYTFKNRMYVEAGPQFGLMYKSWVEFEADVDGADMIIKDYNKEKLNKIDAGMMGGLGFKMRKGLGMTFGVKYYQGFVNVYKERPGTKNRSIFIKVNIPVGAGKSKEKQENKQAKE